MVDGKTYTSNLTKLLKHMDKLQLLQRNISSPVMVHIAPTGICNLDCPYCCYANRDEGQVLSKEQVKSAIKQFATLGVKGLEWTGGGDPSLYKDLEECVNYAHELGYKQGLITNGLKMPYLKSVDKMDWVRISFHAVNLDIKMDSAIEKIMSNAPNTDFSGVYIWTKGSEDKFKEVVRITGKYRIPTRITPDLTLGKDFIDQAMPYVSHKVKTEGNEFTFISDFNVKTERKHNHCYQHNIKPFVFHDGNVYVCPSAALSPDNHLNINEQFKVCSIEDINITYGTMGKRNAIMREHDCAFCKYSQQNEFIDDVLKVTKHNNFA